MPQLLLWFWQFPRKEKFAGIADASGLMDGSLPIQIHCRSPHRELVHMLCCGLSGTSCCQNSSRNRRDRRTSKTSHHAKPRAVICPWRIIKKEYLCPLKGEVAEWSKAHAWKACEPQKGSKGSNPFLSAKKLHREAVWITNETPSQARLKRGFCL